MGLPNVTDNYKGYEDSDLSKHAEKLRDKQFLMVSPLASYSSTKHTHTYTRTYPWATTLVATY